MCVFYSLAKYAAKDPVVLVSVAGCAAPSEAKERPARDFRLASALPGAYVSAAPGAAPSTVPVALALPGDRLGCTAVLKELTCEGMLTYGRAPVCASSARTSTPCQSHVQSRPT